MLKFVEGDTRTIKTKRGRGAVKLLRKIEYPEIKVMLWDCEIIAGNFDTLDKRTRSAGDFICLQPAEIISAS